MSKIRVDEEMFGKEIEKLWIHGGPQQSAGCRNNQGVLHGLQGNRSVVQLSGQQTVVATNILRGLQRLAVGVNDVADVLFSGCYSSAPTFASTFGITG